jgi:hypothetical protein
MRTRALLCGAILILALAGPAMAQSPPPIQYSTTMSSGISASPNTTGTTTNTSSFFSNLMGTRATTPSFNFLSVLPTMPSAQSTMSGQFTTGTSPQAIMILPARQYAPAASKGTKKSWWSPY